VIVSTDTVYGIGAHGLNERAIEKLFGQKAALKGDSILLAASNLFRLQVQGCQVAR
jgi:tRNA A37 threonylcarbamoyladenosine synthetase subunit TsaC/SUA5/YrdC